MALRELLLTLFLFSKLSPSTADIEAGSQVWEAKENFQFGIAEGNVEVECSLICYDFKAGDRAEHGKRSSFERSRSSSLSECVF